MRTHYYMNSITQTQKLLNYRWRNSSAQDELFADCSMGKICPCLTCALQAQRPGKECGADVRTESSQGGPEAAFSPAGSAISSLLNSLSFVLRF